MASSEVVTAADLGRFEGEELELRAILLLMADRLLYEPVAAIAASEGGPDLLRQTALTLGRVSDPRGVSILGALSADPEPAVRHAAVLGLGEMAEKGIEGARRPLFAAASSDDREAAVLAVEGLAKAGVPLEDVVERLLLAPPEELLPRLVPSLYRFRGPGVLRWARQALEATAAGESGGDTFGRRLDSGLRSMAAYAVARNPVPEGAPTLRQLLADSDPWIRGWGARALGRVGSHSDLDRLLALLDDAEPGPVIHALRSGRRLVASGTAAPPDAWRPRLLALFDDPRPGVGITALEAASAWLLDEELGESLLRFGRDGEPRQREVALLALAEAESPRATLLVVPFSREADPVLRAAAA
ncbi:MAG: HEAT repeat domain-containing protein, partial [Holophagales bacterium]|nr:HEAT repeat domain-containing protein [Holophagales bacterium]